MTTGNNRISILGIPVDAITMDETAAILKRFVKDGKPHLVATADASGIAQAQTDPELRSIYESADLVTPDSQGVLWAAKRQGKIFPERVSGVDILERVCRESANCGYRLYFLGAASGVAEGAAARLTAKYPGCQIVGTHDGFFPADQDEQIASMIGELQPDFLFVAMGIPRQEKFILSQRDRHRAHVAMGVGGSFDVFSGRVKRAPIAFQRLKIEWLWRLLQNPKKIGKVMLLPRFVGYVLREKR